MKTLRRYISRQIIHSTVLVLFALLGLFAFFDLIHELGDYGKGHYQLFYIFIYVLLSVPGHVYELIPIATLIGTLFALAQLVVSSEYTVMRASGVSVLRMTGALLTTGVLFAALTFAFGEFIAPQSEQFAQKLRTRAISGLVAQQFRSGLWVKDEDRFINVAQVLPDSTLLGVKIYQFDPEHKLAMIRAASRGSYLKDNQWLLKGVVETDFKDNSISVKRTAEMNWKSVLNPQLLSVLLVVPDQMSAWNLYSYIQHLTENGQNATRYEIALWTKLTYPLAALVMMVLALPFAYIQRRSGGVGTRVFIGIMLGLIFNMLSRLSGHLGQIYNWPPAIAAFLPIVVFLSLAVGMLMWVERR